MALLLAVSTFAAPPAPDRMGELSQKILELSQKLQECGGNQDCQNKIIQELNALQQEYIHLVQGVTQKAGVPADQPLSCDKFIRPGWSCLPLSVSVSRRIEERNFGWYCDPPGILPCNRKEYISREHHFVYSAEGAGYLIYTRDYAEFEIWTRGEVPNVHLAQYEGFVRTCDPREGGGCDFLTRSYPLGNTTVKESFGFGAKYPAETGTPTNCWYSGAAVSTTDSEYPADRDSGFNPHNADLKFIITPEMIKSAVASGQFFHTFRWHVLDTDGRSYQNHTVDVRLKIGEPPEDVGILAVSPSDAFRSSGPNDQGLFVPDSKVYTLKNIGKASIDYSVEEDAAWFKLSGSASGTLAPGQSSTMTAEVESAKARVLDQGSYKGTIKFVNATNGKGTTTRPAELTIGEMQRWKVLIDGWRRSYILPGKKYQDTDGTTKLFVPCVKFIWHLEGEFVLRKRKGKWQYDEGTVTVAKMTPVADFQPPTLYDCTVVKCQGKATIDGTVGMYLTGYLVGNEVHLRWPPREPFACLSCKPKHPAMPSNTYEPAFQCDDFTTDIGLEGYELKNATFPPVSKGNLESYQVTLKRLN